MQTCYSYGSYGHKNLAHAAFSAHQHSQLAADFYLKSILSASAGYPFRLGFGPKESPYIHEKNLPPHHHPSPKACRVPVNVFCFRQSPDDTIPRAREDATINNHEAPLAGAASMHELAACYLSPVRLLGRLLGLCKEATAASRLLMRASHWRWVCRRLSKWERASGDTGADESSGRLSRRFSCDCFRLARSSAMCWMLSCCSSTAELPPVLHTTQSMSPARDATFQRSCMQRGLSRW